MKHIVLIKSSNPGKFNYAKFGNYKNRKGKLIELIDPNGLVVSGWEMHQAVVPLDINDEDDRRIYEFLKDHPMMGGKFTLEDISAQENKAAEEALAKADSVPAAAGLSKKEIENLCRLIGLSGDWDDNVRKAKIISYASDNPVKFLEYLNDADAPYKVFIKECLEKKVFTFINGTYKYGSTNIGLSEDQAVMWLKDNSDIYALLKNQLRGNLPKTKQEVVLEELSDDVIEDIKKETGVK